jgi:hypothetical protein
MNTTICLIITLIAIFIGIILWCTETPADRARRWSAAGMSQRAIADRLGVTRYRVRVWLAA